jgi:hypothetical protein
LTQPGEQSSRGEQLHASRCQLNGQGQAIQAGTQLRDGAGIGIRQMEVGLDGLSLLKKERDCRLV